jgi:hypothetical protein
VRRTLQNYSLHLFSINSFKLFFPLGLVSYVAFQYICFSLFKSTDIFIFLLNFPILFFIVPLFLCGRLFDANLSKILIHFLAFGFIVYFSFLFSISGIETFNSGD